MCWKLILADELEVALLELLLPEIWDQLLEIPLYRGISIIDVVLFIKTILTRKGYEESHWVWMMRVPIRVNTVPRYPMNI